MAQLIQTYPTDLKLSEWPLIADFFPPNQRGRRRKWAMWQIVNAILYITRTGGQWRMMPKDLPPWQTVHGLFPALDAAGPVAPDQCGAGGARAYARRP